jgi:autoinducer 2 (AI-2) kinase
MAGREMTGRAQSPGKSVSVGPHDLSREADMSSKYLLALDVGGGSGRCLVLDLDSGSATTAKRTWTHPQAPDTAGLGYDLDLDDIWMKLGEAAREAVDASGARPRDVLGLAVTSMRNTTVVLDSSDDVLFATPNNDARALGEAFEWAASDGKSVYDSGGHWPTPLFTGSRLLWLRAHAPGLLERARTVMCLSDWAAFRLGGGRFCERSQAAETLLFDLAGGDWAFDLIESLGFEKDLFPAAVDAGTVVGTLSAESAAHLGLAQGIPLAAGGADTQSSLLGSRVVEPGEICIVAGTTMPVQMVTDGPVFDGEGRLWSGRHVIPGRYVLESNGLTTGTVLEWFAEMLFEEYEDPTGVLFAQAAYSEPGGAGTLSTFGACTFDARKLAVPVGNLSMSHMVTPSGGGKQHLSRSLLEGIAFSVRANVEQLTNQTGSEPTALTVSEGMSRSALWTQIVSDVTGIPVRVPLAKEASALGAAICAGVGAGVFNDLAGGAGRVAAVSREHLPGADSEKYQRLYEGWNRACEMRAPSDDHVSVLMTMSLMEKAAPQAAADRGFRPGMLVTASMDGGALRRLRAMGDVHYAGWRETGRISMGGDDLIEALRDYDVLITEMDIVDFEAIRGLPGLHAIGVCRVNPVNVDVESATAYGIPVFNTPGRNADAVADLTLAFMIMLARKMPASALYLRKPGGAEGDLVRMGQAYSEFQGGELWRKNVGILGLGSVGREVARRVRSCGAHVLFCDPAVEAGEGKLHNAEKATLEQLLSQSDFVTLHAPANESTKAMMAEGQFAVMKEGAFFINTARASLVDYGALAAALESGRLAGAALDVFEVEPPASDDRLVRMSNVIATPHLGGNTFETAAHQGAIVVEQLKALLEGRSPAHLLNPGVMGTFSWEGQRIEPSAQEQERLAAKEKPTMTS